MEAVDHQRENHAYPGCTLFETVLKRLRVHVAPIGCKMRETLTTPPAFAPRNVGAGKERSSSHNQHPKVLNERQANWVEYNSTESSQRSLLINRGYE